LFKIKYPPKKQVLLGTRLAIGLFLIVVGSYLLAGGFLDLTHFENIKNNSDKRLTETKSTDSHPESSWLLTYNLNIEPTKSKFLEENKKISIHTHANSKQILNKFIIFIFHEDLFENYSNLFESYMDGKTNIPKIKNEWTTYATFEINDKSKCDKVLADNTIIRKNDCEFDYNSFNTHIFGNSGKYHLLLTVDLENGTRDGFFEEVSMFSLRDSFEVDLSNKMESIEQITESQQKSNFKAEGLALIGIGIAMMIGGITVLDGYSNSKHRYERFEKEEDKRIYIEKMLVITLARTREQIRKTNETLLSENGVTESVIAEWEKLKISAERLETLTVMGADSVNHEILDDADLVRGTILGGPSSTFDGFVGRLGQIEQIINELLSVKLNSIRKIVLNESLEHIQKLREKHLSKDSMSQNKDLIKMSLDTDERMTKQRFDVPTIVIPDEDSIKEPEKQEPGE